MHCRYIYEVRELLDPGQKFFAGALLIMSPTPRLETLWKNPELAGTWKYAFTVDRHSAKVMIGCGVFTENPRLHRMSPVYELAR